MGASDKETVINHLMNDRFSINLDVYVPKEVEGVVSVDVSKFLSEKIEGNLFPFLDEKVFSKTTGDIPLVGKLKISEETAESVRKIIRDTTKDVKKVNVGRVSIELRNNPVIDPRNDRLRTSGNPSLHISIQGQEDIDVEFTGEEGELVREVLRASLRTPDWTRGDITKGFKEILTTTSYGTPSAYWPPSLLKNLWYQNLGKDTQIYGLPEYSYGLFRLIPKYSEKVKE